MPPTPTPSSPSRPTGASAPSRSVRLVTAREPDAAGPPDGLPLDDTVPRVPDVGAPEGPEAPAAGVVGVLRAALDEVAETAETVSEDLGHALEESVGEILDAALRLRADPRDALAIAAGAAGNVLEGWLAADRHAAVRVLVAGRRLAALLATSGDLAPWKHPS